MEKIKWCLNIKKGIELVEPNENLSKVYIKKSENALKAAIVLKKIKDWEISSCYYAMYFALYAILMKVGVKCENHSCTIEFMKELLKNHFSEEDVELIKKSMKARIDVQYYTNRNIAKDQYEKMVNRAPSFLIKCKEVLLKIKEEEINSIRTRIKNIEDGM